MHIWESAASYETIPLKLAAHQEAPDEDDNTLPARPEFETNQGMVMSDGFWPGMNCHQQIANLA